MRLLCLVAKWQTMTNAVFFSVVFSTLIRKSDIHLFFFLFFKFYFIFKLYITVLDLPNIKMNPPQVHLLKLDLYIRFLRYHTCFHSKLIKYQFKMAQTVLSGLEHID